MKNQIIVLMAVIVLIVIMPSIYAVDNLSNGLVSTWQWENNYADTMGLNNGTNVGASISSSFKKLGNYSLNLTASSEYVNLTTATGMPVGNSSRTISCWAYQTSSANEFGMFNYGAFSNGQSFGLGYKISTSHYFLFVYGSDADTGVNPILNSWTMFTEIYNGSQAFFVVNDTFRYNTSQALNTVATWKYIGASIFGATNDYKGYLDDCYMWNRTLNQSELTTLYNSGVGMSYPFSNVTQNVTVTNFSIKAQNSSNSAYVQSFNVTMNTGGTVYNYSTTNGNITTGLLTNDTRLFNITIVSDGFYNYTLNNTGLSSNLTAQLTTITIVVNYSNTIVFLGDSITAQVSYVTTKTSSSVPTYLSSLGGTWTGITGQNSGVGGSCITNYGPCAANSPMINRITTDVLAYNPRYIVIQAGINDAKDGNYQGAGYPIDYGVFQNQSESMIRNILVNATNSSLIMESFQTYTAYNIGLDWDNNYYSSWIRELAIKYQVPFIEIGYIFNHNETYLADTVHVNQAGADLYNRSINDAILNPNNYIMTPSNWNFYFFCNRTTTVMNVTISAPTMNCTRNVTADWIILANITNSGFKITRADKPFNVSMSNRFTPNKNYNFYLSNGTNYVYTADSNGTINNIALPQITQQLNVTYSQELVSNNIRISNIKVLNKTFKILY